MEYQVTGTDSMTATTGRMRDCGMILCNPAWTGGAHRELLFLQSANFEDRAESDPDNEQAGPFND
jgi:hypothetical protein